MKRQGLLGGVIAVLLVAVIGLAGALTWVLLTRTPVPPSTDRPDAPPYAQRGAYTVGTQALRVQSAGRTLPAWVWYPAAPSLAPQRYTYTSAYGLWASDGHALENAVPARNGAPYPLVVYSHGSGSTPLLSLFLLEHLASQGFVVIAAEHVGNTPINRLDGDGFSANIIDAYAQRPQDIVALLDFAETLTAPNGALEGMIDMERVAVSGHSFGGYTAFAAAGARLDFDALAAWCDANAGVTLADVRPEAALAGSSRTETLTDGACYLLDDQAQIAAGFGLDAPPSGMWDSLKDERIDAVVALAPWNAPIFGAQGLAEVTQPTLILVGTADDSTKAERDAIPFYEQIGADEKYLVQLQNADHYVFVDVCNPLLVRLNSTYACLDAVWDLPRAHDITQHLVTAFLRAQFYDDADAAAALATDAVLDIRGLLYERTP